MITEFRAMLREMGYVRAEFVLAGPAVLWLHGDGINRAAGVGSLPRLDNVRLYGGGMGLTAGRLPLGLDVRTAAHFGLSCCSNMARFENGTRSEPEPKFADASPRETTDVLLCLHIDMPRLL